jgi:hypothetical protein
MELFLFLFTRAVLFYCTMVLIYACANPAEDPEFDAGIKQDGN